MSTFRDFEVLYEKIPHLTKCLTINQALAILMVESFEFTQEEKFHVSLVVCKLEFLRSKNKYTEEMGLAMYPIICDLFTDNTQFENFLLLGDYLDQIMKEMGQKIPLTEYNRMIPVVSHYFKFNTAQYKKDLYSALNLVPTKPKHPQHVVPHHPTQQKEKREFRFTRIRSEIHKIQKFQKKCKSRKSISISTSS